MAMAVTRADPKHIHMHIQHGTAHENQNKSTNPPTTSRAAEEMMSITSPHYKGDQLFK